MTSITVQTFYDPTPGPAGRDGEDGDDALPLTPDQLGSLAAVPDLENRVQNLEDVPGGGGGLTQEQADQLFNNSAKLANVEDGATRNRNAGELDLFPAVGGRQTTQQILEDHEASISANTANSRDLEQLQDAVAAMLQSGTHTNVTVVYDDDAGTISISSTGGGTGGGLTQEQVEDITASLVDVVGGGINVAYDDPAGTLSFSLTGETFTTEQATQLFNNSAKLARIEDDATRNRNAAELELFPPVAGMQLTQQIIEDHEARIGMLNSLLAVDDMALDELQEVLDFIKLNRSDLDMLGISSIAGLQTALDAINPGLVEVSPGVWVGGDMTGDARGAGSIDVQGSRSIPSEVASGDNSTNFGRDNTSSGDDSNNIGHGNTSSGEGSNSSGIDNRSSGPFSNTEGIGNVASDDFSNASGIGNISSGVNSNTGGISNEASGDRSSATGFRVRVTTDDVSEHGIWEEVGATRLGSHRTDSTGLFATTFRDSAELPADGGNVTGSEPTGTLGRGMLTIQMNGDVATLVSNDASGVVRFVELGVLAIVPPPPPVDLFDTAVSNLTNGFYAPATGVFSAGSLVWGTTDPVPAVAGQTFDAFGRGFENATTMIGGAVFFDANGDFISGSGQGNTIQTVTHAAPAGAATVRFSLRLADGPPSVIV